MPGPEVAPDLLAQAAAYDVEEAEAQAGLPAGTAALL